MLEFKTVPNMEIGGKSSTDKLDECCIKQYLRE